MMLPGDSFVLNNYLPLILLIYFHIILRFLPCFLFHSYILSLKITPKGLTVDKWHFTENFCTLYIIFDDPILFL